MDWRSGGVRVMTSGEAMIGKGSARKHGYNSGETWGLSKDDPVGECSRTQKQAHGEQHFHTDTWLWWVVRTETHF